MELKTLRRWNNVLHRDIGYLCFGMTIIYAISGIKMEQPSYTIRTLTYLTEKYPGKQFVLIAGTDVLPTFNKWKNYEQILENYYLYIYPRPGIMPGQLISHPHITLVDAPLMDISSSFIRNAVGQGKNVEYMLPQRVWQYLREMHFYEK